MTDSVSSRDSLLPYYIYLIFRSGGFDNVNCVIFICQQYPQYFLFTAVPSEKLHLSRGKVFKKLGEQFRAKLCIKC